MAALEKLEHFNSKVSEWLEWVGFAGILIIILVTTVDVVGAKAFLMPIPGSLDIVVLAQLIAASFTVAATLLAGRHVRVDFFVTLFPKRLRNIINAVVGFLGFVLFVIIVWRLALYGYALHSSGEVSPTIRTALYPFAYAAALACIPMCLIFLCQFIRSLRGESHNEP